MDMYQHDSATRAARQELGIANLAAWRPVRVSARLWCGADSQSGACRVRRPSDLFLSALGRACPAPTPRRGRGERCLALAPYGPRSQCESILAWVLTARSN